MRIVLLFVFLLALLDSGRRDNGSSPEIVGKGKQERERWLDTFEKK